MYILGINAYHPDSAACLLKDGQLIAAAEEERFCRVKHWAGLPMNAIKFCLQTAEIGIEDIDYIGISKNPKLYLQKKIWCFISRLPKLSVAKSRIGNYFKIRDIKKDIIFQELAGGGHIKAKFYNIEHHLAHFASSFFVSGFDKAAVVSIDALGDFVSTMIGYGSGTELTVKERVFFPHSLGFLYSAGTQFLGFKEFGDEYKVMGLAACGQPRYLKDFRKIVLLKKRGGFQLNLKYFRFKNEGIEMTWNNCKPVCGKLYSSKWQGLFGPARENHEELNQRHKDIASSLQAIFEEGYFHILNYIYKKTEIDKLCLSGGCALNCVANGKIFRSSPFKEVYIPSVPSDAGTAAGAAYYIYHQVLKKPRFFTMRHAYYGPDFDKEKINKYLEAENENLKNNHCEIIVLSDNELCKQTAKLIADGKIVGWFQGRMEWGPRALGNRSILADPRRKEIKDVLNQRIKHREPFRPFAPSILDSKLNSYFYKVIDSPFMLFAFPIKEDKISEIISSAHVDGTARFQSVNKDTNPLFYQLINEFEKITGVPVLINTSFNENEPIVCNLNEALDCFLRTKMDVLALGNHLIIKKDAI